MAKEADASQRQFTALRTALTDVRRLPENVQKALDDLKKKMDSIEKTPAGRGGGTGAYVPAPVSQRISTLLNSIDGYAFAPTRVQLAEIPRLRTEMADVDARIKKLIDEDLPALNKLMNEAGVPHISIADQAPAVGGRRR
jgi:formiminotetrahydrofolate cyclodeaminase